MHHQITPGVVVQTAYQIELRVRALEGNVAELEAFDGSFVGFRHVSSLTVCLPPAAKTAPAQSLAAAAGAGQGAGTLRTFAPLRHGLGTWCVICAGDRRIVCGYPCVEGRQERRA